MLASASPRTDVPQPLRDQLKQIVGDAGYREGGDIDFRNYRDNMGGRSIVPMMLLRPANTGEVSAVLKLCHQAKQPIAPQGGMTGLVSGAAPLKGEISLSFERMKNIVEVDRLTSTMTVEAGVELQTVQQEAEANNLFFPLDLGARGSCTIGGNLSTNAGGNRVIRYGMTRDLVVGVEAVLADGTVINGLNKLRKNNTGYDLKQLFIGSEGTLGLITQVVLKLSPRPDSQTVAMCALKDFDQVVELLINMQGKLGGNLSAFEVIWQNTWLLIDEHVHSVSTPLPNEHQFYVLIESMGSDAEKDNEQFFEVLAKASEQGLIEEAIIADTQGKIDKLWGIRDAAADVFSAIRNMHAYDVSLNVGDMAYFGEQVEKDLRSKWPDAIIGLFGHIGDGNIHILVHVGPDSRKLHREIDEVIYSLIQQLNGSISAEHGVGIMKKEFLSYSKSESELGLMKVLKQAMDPAGILNPGRIFN